MQSNANALGAYEVVDLPRQLVTDADAVADGAADESSPASCSVGLQA